MSLSSRYPQLDSQLLLHVLTDRDWSRGRNFVSVAEEALKGGATVIQLRDKRADTRTLVNEGLLLREVTRRYGALLIVNDRIDVALAIDADGAHVGQDDMPEVLARKLLGPDRLLGISAGNIQEAASAVKAGADYLGVGPIHATQTKGDAGVPVGVALLAEIRRSYDIPLVAIGGMTAANAGEALKAGATGIAVITAVVNAHDIESATRAFVENLR